MPGPEAKAPGTRQRRNRHSTFAVLTPLAPDDIDIPKLPKVDGLSWNRMTVRWWIDIWSSPMAPEFHKSDVHGLYSLAFLVNDFWSAQTAKERTALMAEIRLQSQRFGLSPWDRRRLQWQIAETEGKQRTNRRQAAREVDGQHQAQRPSGGHDPRGILRDASV